MVEDDLAKAGSWYSLFESYLVTELFYFLFWDWFVVAELRNLAVKSADFGHAECLSHL